MWPLLCITIKENINISDVLGGEFNLLGQETVSGERILFQQDNKPEQTAKIIQEGLAWSCQSPDSNPVTQLWQISSPSEGPASLWGIDLICQEDFARTELLCSKKS